MNFPPINLSFDFSFWTISTVGLLGLIFYYLKNLEKLEKLIALIAKLLKFISKKFDHTYVKYDLQGKINDYLKKVSKRVKHLDINKINIRWVNPENEDEKHYIKNGELILRLRKGENQNENIVNASMTFISYSFLKKAKSYIAKYQRESMDLFVCYDLLKEEKSEILDQFVQDYMKTKMDNEKIADFFEKYSAIDEAGIFYPVLVQELTFLGEKVFAKKRDAQIIAQEVKDVVNFLVKYAHRKLSEENISDFSGKYCQFAIRIIGRSVVVNTKGDSVYTRHLQKISSENESIYLIGNKEHKNFINQVVDKCKNIIDFFPLSDETYKAKIKDINGKDFYVENYMMTLRSNKIKVYHKN